MLSGGSSTTKSLENLHKGVFIKSLNDRPFQVGSLQDAMHQFGLVDRVVSKSDPTFYALVEFSKEEYAQHAVLQRRMFIDDSEVAIGERNLSSAKSLGELPNLNAFGIIEDLNLFPGFAQQSARLHSVLAATQNSLQNIRDEIDTLRGHLEKYLSHVELEILWPQECISILGLDTNNATIFLHQDTLAMKNGRRYLDFGRDSDTLFSAPISDFLKKPIHPEELKRLSVPERIRLHYRLLLEIHREVPWLGNLRLNVEHGSITAFLGATCLCEIYLEQNPAQLFLQGLQNITPSKPICELCTVLRVWATLNGLIEASGSQVPLQSTIIVLMFALFFLLQEANLLMVPPKFYERLKKLARHASSIMEQYPDSFLELLRPVSSRIGTSYTSFRLDTVCEAFAPSWVEPIDLLAAFEILLEEVALLTPSFEETDEETLDGFMTLGVFIMTDRLWLGRRNIRRKMHSELTESLSSMTSSVILRAAGYMKIEFGHAILGFRALEGSRDELNRLTGFVQYLLDSCLTSLLGENRAPESQPTTITNIPEEDEPANGTE
ncbi:unnamed protein product, partial [Mesorhabditis spiculigera]